MKKNNKGFMLVETIIVTVVVATIMISLYVAFNRIYGAYESKKTYMDIEPIYAIDIIKDYLIDEFLIEDILSDADNNGIVNVISNKEIKIELKDYHSYHKNHFEVNKLDHYLTLNCYHLNKSYILLYHIISQILSK